MPLLQQYKLQDDIPLGPGREYPAHYNGKVRLARLLQSLGFEVLSDSEGYQLPTDLGERNYTPDIIARRGSYSILFEVDGQRGHSTKSDLNKMVNRDRAFYKEEEMLTVRIKTDVLVGRKKQSDEEIIQEIAWQLNQQLWNIFLPKISKLEE